MFLVFSKNEIEKKVKINNEKKLIFWIIFCFLRRDIILFFIFCYIFFIFSLFVLFRRKDIKR